MGHRLGSKVLAFAVGGLFGIVSLYGAYITVYVGTGALEAVFRLARGTRTELQYDFLFIFGAGGFAYLTCLFASLCPTAFRDVARVNFPGESASLTIKAHWKLEVVASILVIGTLMGIVAGLADGPYGDHPLDVLLKIFVFGPLVMGLPVALLVIYVWAQISGIYGPMGSSEYGAK